MNVHSEIDKIIEEDYKGYRPTFYKRIGVLHNILRSMVTDVEFLAFLRDGRKLNPKKPEYKIPDEILKQMQK